MANNVNGNTQGIGRCDICDYENLNRAFRKGICRARVECRRRFDEAHPWYVTFRALPFETRLRITTLHDAERAALRTALAADFSVLPVARSLEAIMRDLLAGKEG